MGPPDDSPPDPPAARGSPDDSATHDPRLEETLEHEGDDVFGIDEPVVRKLGRYTLLDELGAGGMGAVYKAWDPTLDRPVALKMMHAGRVASGQAVRRFLNEARAVARIAHRHIVEIHDMGVVDRMPYFTMSLVDGPSFEAWIEGHPEPDPRALCAMLAPVARALGHVHRAGVVHRDIKPANLLVDSTGEVRLVDFGVARLAGDDMTRTGQIIGTPAYMAPEQARGAEVDARADIFGLGGVLYRAVTGALPPRFDDGPLHMSGVHRDLEAICLMALAGDPAARYPDADTLAADLERFARGEPVHAAVPGPARRLGWWIRRRRVALLVVGGLVLGGAFGLQVTRWWSDRRAQAAAEAAEATAARVLTEAGDAIDTLRAAGRPDAARERFDSASARPDVQGTAALARFLLDGGQRALADRRAEAPALLAAAYGQAADPAVRAEALIGLGRHHEARGEFDRLATVLETLRRLDPDRFAGPAVRPLRVKAALLGRRPAEAAALLEGDRRRFADDLAILGRTIPTRLPTTPLAARARPTVDVGDLLRDGRRLLQIDLDLVEATPALTPVGRLPDPADGRWAQAPRLFADPEGRPVMLGRVQAEDGPRTALYRFAGFGHPPVPLWRAEASAALLDAVQADLDGDGRAAIFFAHPFRIWALSPAGDDRWTAAEAHDRMPHTWSIVNGLAVVDRGGPALLASLGEWRAYDVRLLRPAPDERHLALDGRLKLGRVDGLSPAADGVWTVNDGLDLKPEYFPPGEAPTTPTLYRIAADGAVDLRVEVPGGQRLDHPVAFDLRGDGRIDVAVMRHGEPAGAQITLDAAEDGRWTLPLPGFEVRAALDLDGDGDDELIAVPFEGGFVRVIGVGETPLPPLEAPAPAPPGDRLADLVALGRLQAARDQYRVRVRLGRRTVESAWRAGELGLRLDDAAGAAEDFAESARRASRAGRPDDARRGWRAAADARRRARDTPGERAALTALRPLVSGAEQREVDGLLAALGDRRLTRIAFDGELDPGWRLLHPDRVTRDVPAGRLRVLAQSEDGPLAILPLVRHGPRVTVRGDVAIERAEISGNLRIALVRGHDPGAEPLGGLLLFAANGQPPGLRVRAVGPGAATDIAAMPSAGIVRLPATPFVVDLDRTRGELHLEWGDPAADGIRVTSRLPPEADTDGPLALALSAHPQLGARGGWMRCTLGPLEITDATVEPGPPTLIESARRDLADGWSLEALTAIEDLDAPIDQAAALDGLDRLELADALIDRLPPALHAARDRLLVGWMHQRPDETFDRLLALGRPALAEALFHRAWSLALRLHVDDAETRAALAAALGRFDLDAAAVDPARAAIAAEVLGHAVRLAHVSGQVRAARRGYTRLFGFAERLPTITEGFRHELVQSAIDRALLDARHGRPVDARRWLEEALARAGAPEWVEDRIRASPVLSAVWAR